MIPLVLKLKKQQHKAIAQAQDIIVEELYNVFEKAVLHGGTCIWRCYGGNRFSEDVDVYIPKKGEKIEQFFRQVERRGLQIQKKKIGENSIFSELAWQRILVRFEAVFKEKEGVLGDYQTAEGNVLTVYMLTPEDLVREKVQAYLNRRKVRDLYDLFLLLRQVKKKEEVMQDVQKLLAQWVIPIDKNELRVLIIEGLVPEIEKIKGYIEHWCG